MRSGACPMPSTCWKTHFRGRSAVISVHSERQVNDSPTLTTSLQVSPTFSGSSSGVSMSALPLNVLGQLFGLETKS